MKMKEKGTLLAIGIMCLIGGLALVQYGKTSGWPDWMLTLAYLGLLLGACITILRVSSKPPRDE